MPRILEQNMVVSLILFTFITMWSSLWIRHGEGVWLLSVHALKNKIQKRSHHHWSHPVSCSFSLPPLTSPVTVLLLIPISRGKSWEETSVDFYCPCMDSQECMCLPWPLSTVFFSFSLESGGGKDKGSGDQDQTLCCFPQAGTVHFYKTWQDTEKAQRYEYKPFTGQFNPVPSFPTQ